MQRTSLFATLVLAAVPAGAFAQLNAWTIASGGDWSDSAGWALGHVPIVGESPSISNGAVVDYDIGVSPLFTVVQIAGGSGSSGGMTMSSGTVHSTSTFFVGANGDGTLDLSGTGEIICDNSFGVAVNSVAATGSMLMNGGSVQAATFFLGNSGTGALQMNTGAITAGNFIMGNNGTGSGTFTMTGGTLDVSGGMTVGGQGTGVADFFAGVADIASLRVGSGNLGSGVLGIGTGTGIIELTANQIYSGSNGATGTINQASGTVTALSLRMSWSGVASSFGTYNLSGGLLDTGTIERGDNVPPVFNMTGGTLIVDVMGTVIRNMSLTPTGGLILPNGKFVGTTTIFGDLSLGLGATIKYDIDTPGASDQVIVNGRVVLQGMLDGVLLNTPASADSHVIIDNDLADAVIGTFAGLPEGATVTFFEGVTPHDFEITYVGGDGNDVVLNFVDCPPDLNNDGFLDGADIALFVSFFLAGDLAADFNNDTFLDGGDIATFITLFLAGC